MAKNKGEKARELARAWRASAPEPEPPVKQKTLEEKRALKLRPLAGRLVEVLSKVAEAKVNKLGILVVAALLSVSGCQTAQIESRDALLDEIREHMLTRIGPEYSAYVTADPALIIEQKEQRTGWVDDCVAEIDKIVPRTFADAGGGQ